MLKVASKSLSPDWLYRAALFFWLVLLFIQPFEKFTALKYLLMLGLLGFLAKIFISDEGRATFRPWGLILSLGAVVVVWCCVVSALGPYPSDSFHSLFRDLLLQIELLVCGVLFVRGERQAKQALWAIICGFAVFTLLSGFEVFLYLRDYNLSDGQIPRSHRSFWAGYGSTAGVCLPLIIAFGISATNSVKQRVLLGAIILLGLVMTGLYGSRSPLLVIATSVVVLFVFCRAWKIFATVFLLFILGGIWAGTQTNLGYLEKYRSLAKSDTYVTNQGLSLRFDVWLGVVEVIQARPILGYGYGWKKLAWAINDGGYAERWREGDLGKAAYFIGEELKASYGKVNPHNYFLQVAFEIGLPGLLLVLGFWFAVFWLGIKGLARGDLKTQQLRIVILTTLFAYMLSNFANGFWVGGLANIACALVGILLGLRSSEESSPAVERK
jgi:O-antigen ligase